MASSHTIERSGRADWTLMTAIHDALRRDLDELITTTAGHAAARARWIVFRDQLRQTLLEAMDDE
jgi:hypothetical protein